MNPTEQTKVDELRIWHDVLEDTKLRLGAPDDYTATLRTHAEVLQRLGIITTQELFELMKQVDEAVAQGDATS